MALAHLLLVLLGALHVGEKATGGLGRGLRYYAALTGAGDSFAFFAPEIHPQLRARFVLTASGGQTWEDFLERGRSHEAGIRLANIAAVFELLAQRPTVGRSLLAAMAGKMFSRHEAADAVTVVIEQYHVPCFADFRAGQLPHWLEIYGAEFRRRLP